MALSNPGLPSEIISCGALTFDPPGHLQPPSSGTSVEERYSISLSVRQCQRLFHQLGFTLQRPRRQACEADPLQEEAFLKNFYQWMKDHVFSFAAKRSLFPTTQQFDTNMGSQGATTSRALCLNPSEGELLWSTQPENRMPADQRDLHIQCPDLWRLSPLPSSTYSGEAVSYPGQCQLAQGTRFERLFHRESRPSGAYFPAALFPRTLVQSNAYGGSLAGR